MIVVPLSLKEANRVVDTLHRHHKAVWVHRFSIGAQDESGTLVGVAIAGQPVCRELADGGTIEVTRLATDGTANACSFLYAAVRRIAREMGFRRVITYTLATEPGTSLRAAGWTCTVARTRARTWNMPGRPRKEHAYDLVPKSRWECVLCPR